MSDQLSNKRYSVQELLNVNPKNSSQRLTGTTNQPAGPPNAIPRFSTLDPTAVSFVPNSQAPSTQASSSQTPSPYLPESDTQRALSHGLAPTPTRQRLALAPRTPDNSSPSLGTRTTGDSSHFPGSRPLVVASGTLRQVLEFRTQQSGTPHILFPHPTHGAADDCTELPITPSPPNINHHHPSHDHHVNHSQQRSVFGQTQTSTNYGNHGNPWNLRDWRNGGLPARTGHSNNEPLIHGREATRLSSGERGRGMGPSSQPEGSSESSPSTQNHTEPASQGQEIHDSNHARRGKENAQAAHQQAQIPLNQCQNAIHHQSERALQAPVQEQTQVALSQTSSHWPCRLCGNIGDFAAAEMEVQTLRDEVQKQQRYLDDARARITALEGRLRAQAQHSQQLPQTVHPFLLSQGEERQQGEGRQEQKRQQEKQKEELQKEEHPYAKPNDSFLDDDDADGGVSLSTSDDTKAGRVGK